MAVGKAGDTAVGMDAANGDLVRSAIFEWRTGDDELMFFVVVGDARGEGVSGLCGADRLDNEMRLYFWTGYRGAAENSRAQKFRGWVLEKSQPQRGIPGGALDGFAGLGRREKDAVLQIERRLARNVIGMPRNEADLVADAHPDRAWRMDRNAARANAVLWSGLVLPDYASVVMTIVNPVAGVAVPRIVGAGQRPTVKCTPKCRKPTPAGRRGDAPLRASRRGWPGRTSP